MINNFIDSNNTWKIQINLKISCISLKDTSEERYMYLKSEYVIVIPGSVVNYLIKAFNL